MNSPFPFTTIGKMIPKTGIQRCQRVVWTGAAQIFLECSCGDSIAIIPNSDVVDRNKVIDSISNEDAAAFFKSCRWTVYDRKTEKTRCPRCAELNKIK